MMSILLPALVGVMLLMAVFYLGRRNLVLRHRATKVITSQREQLRVTLTSIGDAVMATDAQGNVTYLNAVAQQLTGWSFEEAHGRPLVSVFKIINENSRQPAENPVAKVLTQGQIVGLANHTILIAKDGTERPIDDSAAPIRGQDGQIIGVVLVFHDISERRQVEKERDKSERRLRLALTAAHMVAWEWDIATGKVVLSDNAAEVLGLPPGSSLDASEQGFALIHPEDVERHRATVMKAVKDQGSYLTQYRLIRPSDGSAIWVEERAQAVPGPDAGVRLVGATMDITAKHEAGELLRQREQQLQLMADNAPVFLAHCDMNGRYKFVNKPYAGSFGLTPEQVIGKHIVEIVGIEAFSAFKGHVAQALAGQSVEFEIEVPYEKTGRQFMRCAYVPEWEGTKVVGLVAAIINITERIHAEPPCGTANNAFNSSWLPCRKRFLPPGPTAPWIISTPPG